MDIALLVLVFLAGAGTLVLLGVGTRRIALEDRRQRKLVRAQAGRLRPNAGQRVPSR